MANMAKALHSIRVLDELSELKTSIHQLHPLAKLIVTLVYLVTIISFNKYEISGMLPLIVFPIVLILLAELPVKPLMKRVLFVLPLIIGIGIFNPILDSRPMFFLGDIHLSYGWISFISILIKCLLTVIISLILIATTGMTHLAIALRMLKVPKLFVLQLLLTYRYVTVLMEEVIRTTTAYSLRAPRSKGIHYKDWGSLIGQLLLRTIDRGQNVYTSMCCRGFNGDYATGNIPKLNHRDFNFTLFWILFFLLVRAINFSKLFGILLTGASL